MDIFALIVILIIVAAAIWIVVTLGSLPGQIAKEKHHPQAEAINILGWIGILTLGVSWFVAIVWAYAKPPGAVNAELLNRISELETQVAELSSEEAQQ
ncbi:MAG: DUF3302 domain-containing protein [Halieaceae bacterium]